MTTLSRAAGKPQVLPLGRTAEAGPNAQGGEKRGFNWVQAINKVVQAMGQNQEIR